MTKQRGFSPIEGILIVAVLVIIGTIGYLAYTNVIAPKTESAKSADAQPVKVESSADLKDADTALDAVALDDTDSAQLDSATDNF